MNRCARNQLRCTSGPEKRPEIVISSLVKTMFYVLIDMASGNAIIIEHSAGPSEAAARLFKLLHNIKDEPTP